MRAAALVAALAAALAVASPAAVNHVVHERRSDQGQWTRLGRAPADRVLRMRVGLQQSNLDKAPQWLDEVSNPASDKFGQHWSVEDVIKTFRPSDETIDSVRNWLSSSGVHDHAVDLGLHWVKFNATVKQVEELLKAEYSVFQHNSGTLHVGCDSYSLPEHVSPKVDLIMPTVHFDSKARPGPGDDELRKRAITSNVKPGNARDLGSPYNGFVPKVVSISSTWKDLWNQLENCNTTIVPNCLRALYAFPPGFSKHPKNSYGIVEFTPQAYVPSDLDLFFKNFSKKAIGTRPILNSIDGGFVQTDNTGFGYNGESNLDLEYAMTLIYPQNTTLFQVGDEVEGASFNDFLDGIDASYCTYMGGDDPLQDAIYPDPYGGYQGPKDCGKWAPSKVISVSYAYNEADLTPFYENRQCNEYMKLGLMGTSVLFSSGDYGVAGNGDQCIDPTTGNYNDGASGRFNPSFPGTCPYITSVGATEVKKGIDFVKTVAQGRQAERACETVIYSGGGFSNNFAMPAYQSAAVKSYFKNSLPPYTTQQYNTSQMTRGFPDIAANGANYLVTIQGKYALVYGTSASSPTLGSIFTLINEARLYAGKSSIGFVNPVAYAHPGAFHDVVEGTNPGCGTAGFSAVKGWDPVTGLGTPNFVKLLEIYLKLP